MPDIFDQALDTIFANEAFAVPALIKRANGEIHETKLVVKQRDSAAGLLGTDVLATGRTAETRVAGLPFTPVEGDRISIGIGMADIPALTTNFWDSASIIRSARKDAHGLLWLLDFDL